MSDEWIIYTRGEFKYLDRLRKNAIKNNSNFEWKIEGNFLFFRPKSEEKISDELNDSSTGDFY